MLQLFQPKPGFTSLRVFARAVASVKNPVLALDTSGSGGGFPKPDHSEAWKASQGAKGKGAGSTLALLGAQRRSMVCASV